MSEFTLDSNGALRQAILTAEDFLRCASRILDKSDDRWTIRDAIELAKVMATDFNTSMMCLKLQEIRDALTNSKDEV